MTGQISTQKLLQQNELFFLTFYKKFAVSQTFASYGVFLKQNRNTYFSACFTQHTGFLFPQLGF